MTTQVKLLNDALVATAKMLDTIYSDDDPILWISDNGEEIEITLQEASEILALVKPEDNGGNTWDYDNGEPKCEGGNCRL